MKLCTVGAAVLNQTPMDWQGNYQRIVGAISEARKRGVTVLCLPEMCITGYGCEDAFLSPGLQHKALEMLDGLRSETRGMLVTLGLPLLYRNALFNAVSVLVDGEIRGFVAKRYLAGDGLHYEPRWFNPWPAGKRDDIRLFYESYPIGDIFFDCSGVIVGLEICEDAWVARRPGADLAYRGCDIILNPSASHFAFGKLDIRKGFVVEGSRAFAVTYVYSNLVGNDAGRTIYDGGALVASAGHLLASGPRFSYAEYAVTSAVVDIERTRMTQSRTHSFRPNFDDDRSQCIEVACDLTHSEHLPPAENPGAEWEHSPQLKMEEFTRAISLALFDYLRRSYSQGFVISLSGGADSSACACLVATMVELATIGLGPEGIAQRLAHVDGTNATMSTRDWVRRLLLCAYQPTRNSSETTRHAAQSVAEAINAEYLELNVDTIVQAYVKLIEDGLGRPLTWETDDVTLQNIQARSRGPSVWMLANIRRALLVATSNRSEAAVGYATMDGDTCGGLSPIAGIDKAFLRQWLVWMRDSGPAGLAPIRALEAVTVQAPTAELRPQAAEQTDEGDLMPYPLLDAIEKHAIRDKRMPVEVFHLVRQTFSQYPPAQLAAWIERFFTLWSRNQWKRERFAPSFHVDDENLDPKTWCRFPILSAGFSQELRELRRLVAREVDGG